MTLLARMPQRAAGLRRYAGRAAALLFVPLLIVAGCSVGPKYHAPSAVPPQAVVPPAFKETPPPPPGWNPVQPADDQLRGKWWQIFHDDTLNTLEDRVQVSNQNIAQAEAAYRAAVEDARAVNANLYPTVTAGPQALREKESQHKPFIASQTGSTTGTGGTGTTGTTATTIHYTSSDYVISGGFNYEIDAWGRIRHEITQARELAQASAADLATVSLSMHSQLALDYFELRGLDTQQSLLATTVKAYENSLQLTENRYKGGIATEVDVAQARTQLEATRQAEIDTGVQRTQLEHAIATLTGQVASSFGIMGNVLTFPPPVIPPGVASTLVERRPDVAAAERRVAAANENIGIQRAAYFPTLTLIANGGFESTELGNLIQGPSSLWSFGATAIETIFDAGRRRALNREAEAQYDEQVAIYRQASLTAFEQVEDELAAIRLLQQEAAVEQEAVTAGERYLELALARYKGGLGTYLDVITAQAAVLNTQRTAADVLSREYVASVSLVMALGGGWERADLPAGQRLLNAQ